MHRSMTLGRVTSISHIARWRLHNQALDKPRFDQATDVVRWMGVVQAQDFAAAKWALGQRMTAATETVVARAFNEGAILRTHVLRPTWHLVLPSDIRWMLALSAPRVKAASAYQHRALGLTPTLLRRSHAVLEKALSGGHQMTRAEFGAALDGGRIALRTPLIVSQLLMAAEVDGVICSGPLRGKQHTYALLEERAPLTPSLARDEALSRLAQRFFTSHGPATIRDFAWWSGLLARDARRGLEAASSELACEVVDGEKYWRTPSDEQPSPRGGRRAHLLPNYDEYIVAYADRRAVYDVHRAASSDPRSSPLFSHTVLVQGRVVGTWRRSVRADAVAVTILLTHRLGRADKAAVTGAVQRYAAFLGKSLQLDYGT
jgi:hypothetical protein